MLINLTGEPQFEEVKNEVCCYCDKPFKHYIKNKKSKEGDLTEVEIITSHPACKRTHKKMENIKNKIIKTKKTLHDLRTSQLNLEFEMFINHQIKLDDDTDEIFTLLQKKGIISSSA